MTEFLAQLTNGEFEAVIASRTTTIVTAFVIVSSLIIYLVFRRREVASDAAVKNTLATFGLYGFNLVFVPVAYFAEGWIEAFYNALHIPYFPSSIWDGWPIMFVLFIGFAAKDFLDYWTHRLMHTKWFWPLHAVHHSDTHVNGFTAYRVHFLEGILMKASYIFLLTWAGFPNEQVALIALLEALHGAYVHLESDFDHGPFNWLIASPRFHRWHHADHPEIYGKNLANHMPIYDMLFGTYHNPAPCPHPLGGLSDGIPDHNIIKLAILPYTLWKQRIQKTFGYSNTTAAASEPMALATADLHQSNLHKGI
jgi:sterol desaturase/sphingolipid hydroxylase (fatty acid hydroxylase superfamily)